MINRLRLYTEPDPEWSSIKMPDIDLKALEPTRETHIVKDKFGDVHISQRRDGVLQVISLDESEILRVVQAIEKLIGDNK